MTRFHACQAITGKWEGGWSDHPDDPGGKTMYGLTDRVWQAYLRQHGKPARPVRSATKAEVEELFRRQYWDAVRGDDLPPGIDLAVYDFAINAGPSRAIRHLQAALGVRQDGVIGHVSLAAAREAYDRDEDGDVIRRIMASREAFKRRLPTWSTFGKGWTNRLRDVAQRAARMEEIEDKALTFSAEKPLQRPAQPTRPVIYNPTPAATKPLPEPVVPVPPAESVTMWTGLAGAGASILAAVTSPWALGAVALALAAAGIWAVKTGRISFTRPEAAP
jgi:lysozyme family protein